LNSSAVQPSLDAASRQLISRNTSTSGGGGTDRGLLVPVLREWTEIAVSELAQQWRNSRQGSAEKTRRRRNEADFHYHNLAHRGTAFTPSSIIPKSLFWVCLGQAGSPWFGTNKWCRDHPTPVLSYDHRVIDGATGRPLHEAHR